MEQRKNSTVHLIAMVNTKAMEDLRMSGEATVFRKSSKIILPIFTLTGLV